MTTQTDIATCRFCGQEIEPCANCGGIDGLMIPVHGKWIHQRQVDCIVHLRAELEAAQSRIAELEHEATDEG